MLTIKTKGLLLNIINHCKRIEDNIIGLEEKNFYADENIKDVICFNLLQIGELAKNLETDFTNTYANIPWRSVKGMRDRIVHGYGTMDMNRVWLTAIENVKPLREYCEQIINENQDQ